MLRGCPQATSESFLQCGQGSTMLFPSGQFISNHGFTSLSKISRYISVVMYIPTGRKTSGIFLRLNAMRQWLFQVILYRWCILQHKTHFSDHYQLIHSNDHLKQHCKRSFHQKTTGYFLVQHTWAHSAEHCIFAVLCLKLSVWENFVSTILCSLTLTLALDPITSHLL